MSIRIGIVSPSRRQGETTLAILLGLALEHATGGKVCITATGADYLSARSYLGIQEEEDVTKSASQLTQLLESGAVTRAGFRDYVTPVTPNTDILLSSNASMSEIEGDRLFSNALSYLEDYDYVITDVNSSLDSAIARKIYEDFDFIIVTFSQDVVVTKKLRTWMDSGAYPDKMKVGYVLNGYCPIVGDMKSVARRLGIHYASKMTKLTLNPYIRKFGNEGKLYDLLTYTIKKDTRGMELYYDLENIVSMVSRNLAFPVKWGE